MGKANAGVIVRERRSIVQSYARYGVAFAKGRGPYLWDEDGKRYLDLLCGISVTNLGHAHPHLLKAATAQMGRLSHSSNLFYQKAQVELAEALIKASGFARRVAFCNTGAEANELLIKYARRFGAASGRYEILAFHGGFHGRTYGALSMSGQHKLHKGMEPLLPGFRHVPFNDLEAARKAVNRKTAAIIVEPVQGENGVIVGSEAFLVGLRRLADRHGILLLLDEIQTGLGRGGELFAFQNLGYDCVPDLMSLGKSLGGGLPLAAVLVGEKAAPVLGLGEHGTTMGGNPVACAAGLAQLQWLLKPVQRAARRKLALAFKEGLLEIQRSLPDLVLEVRAQGLMFGLQLSRPARPLAEAALEAGLVVNATADTVLRLLPPYILTPAQAREALGLLKNVLTPFALSMAKAAAPTRN
jgi:predicted acetylornithine/succinylornithine family transaminase